jgi:hypothetical protein
MAVLQLALRTQASRSEERGTSRTWEISLRDWPDS